jgi:hypothetical protein
MRWRTAFAVLVIVALLGATAATGASQREAQVKAAVARGISAVDHNKGKALGTAVARARVSLSHASAVSAKARSAKALALRGFAKASLAAAQQQKAEAAMTRMQYSGANTATAVASKDMAAAVVLLKKAARLLGIATTVKPA